MTTKRTPARRPGRWTLVLAAALAPAVGARGEDAKEAPPATGGAELVEEIEVKGRRPTRSASLEAREVRETAARDVGEALDGLADLAKVRKGGIANDVVLRGMKKDDLAVLIDGQQLHGACPGRMDPPAFHLDYAEVERIEVKKGPFDVTHPGGLGGVVDVRTRGTRRAGLGAELNLDAGSAGARETSGVLAYEAGGSDALAGAAYKTAQPFASGDGRNFTLAVPPTNAMTGQRNGASYRDTSGGQTAYDVRSVWGKVGWAPAEGHRLEASYTRQASADVLYPYLTMDGVADDTDRLATSYALGPTGALRRGLAQVYWNRVVHDMTDAGRCSASLDVGACSGALPRGYSMRTLARSRTLGAKLEAELGEGGAWLAGADLASRNWDNTTTRLARMSGLYGDEATLPDVTADDVGVYAQARRALGGGLTATAGARLDLARTRAGVDRGALYAAIRPGEDPRLSRTEALPSGNLQLEWAAARDATLSLGVGHGTRMPDPQELYLASSAAMAGMPAWVGNPGLRPTRSDELDAGARYAAGGVLVKVQAFHAWIADYVTLVGLSSPAGPARSYANVAARTYGGELSARIALPRSLFASAGLSYTRGLNDTTGGSLAEIPPLKSVLALRWDVRRLFVEVEEVMAARQSRVDASLQESPTAAWAITNVKVGGAWRGVKLFAGVRNLLDRFYYEHLSYQRDPNASGVRVPEPGRTLYLNAQYQR